MKIRLNENSLHRLIKESVKRVISELNWKTADSACGKSEYLDDSDDAMKSIRQLRGYLEDFINNSDKSFRSQYVGRTKWKGGNFPNHRANKLIDYLDEIEKFVLRKKEQANNLYDYANDTFEKQHNDINSDDYYDSLVDDTDNYDSWNDSQKEFANRKL